MSCLRSFFVIGQAQDENGLTMTASFFLEIVVNKRLPLWQYSGTFMIIYDPFLQKMLMLYISIKKGELTTAGKKRLRTIVI